MYVANTDGPEGYSDVAGANGKADVKPARKKPGPPKGTPKVAGSGRQKQVETWTSDAVRSKMLPAIAHKALAILSGEMIECAGPTGKTIRRKATISEQIKIIEMAWKKCQPDLATQTLQGPGEEPLIPQAGRAQSQRPGTHGPQYPLACKGRKRRRRIS